MMKARRMRKLVPVKKLAKPKDPFHVVKISVNDKHVGYDIYANNQPFLKQVHGTLPLKRHEAYAIAALLNTQQRFLKWAERFSDPYV